MNRFIGKLHSLTREGRGALRDFDRQVSHPRDLFRRKDRTSGKSPGAVIEDADSKTPVLRFSDGSNAAIFSAYSLGCTVQETDITVLSP